MLLMTRMTRDDWRAESAWGRAAQWCWSWAVVVFVVHLAMAFHFFHQWSHQRAFDHTRDVSGVGEGIYVSYLFTWLWIGDAAWWWARPASYAGRNVWLSFTLHLFMLFIVFNGTVVFEDGPIQIAGATGTLAIAAAWLTGCKQRKNRAESAAAT